jgi:uncharacterized protein YjbI with pentapeptide repeats
MNALSFPSAERGSSAWLAKLEEAVLTGACFGRSDFETEDLRAARLPNIDLRGSRLAAARFDGAVLAGACFRAANMQGVSLVGADLRRAGLREAILVDVDLRNADLREANLLDADLTRAKLDGSKIDGAVFNAASLRSADLAGALFGDVPLVGRCPLLQISGIGQERSTLTAYRTAEGSRIVLENRLCDESDLVAALSSPPHLCDPEEAAAIAGLIRAHQARSA